MTCDRAGRRLRLRDVAPISRIIDSYGEFPDVRIEIIPIAGTLHTILIAVGAVHSPVKAAFENRLINQIVRLSVRSTDQPHPAIPDLERLPSLKLITQARSRICDRHLVDIASRQGNLEARR